VLKSICAAASPAFAGSALLAALALTGCAAVLSPEGLVGRSDREVGQQLGSPTGRHTLPDGGTRLEYATGPFGRHTWMLDIDAQGRVARSEQVLGEQRFAQVREGMTRDELLRLIGRPGETRHGGRAGGEVWNWRYPTNDCLWFELGMIDGRVRAPGYAIDPRCDAPSDARSSS
jgi:hypothetical protein